MLVVVVCVILGLLISNFFAGVTISVFPRRAHVTPPPSLQAALDAPVGVLSYQLLSVAGSATRTAPASGSVQVNTVAQGTVTIYNTYSSAAQKLVANTRFQAPNAKIYRIHTAVTVPGMKKSTAGVITPGSVQALVYADKPGADYNISSGARLTIPGFVGDPRYAKFYAQANSISGGSSGMMPAVAPADLKNAEVQMQQELSTSLPGEVSSHLPDGFAPIAGTLSLQYGTLSNTDAGSGSALLTENATATVAIIRTSDVANAVAKLQVPGYDGAPVNFAEPERASFSIATGTPYSAKAPSLSLIISGISRVVWQFDENQLKQALTAKNKAEFETIVRTFSPAIAKATASIRPFWKSVFPSDPAQIKVEIVDDGQ